MVVKTGVSLPDEVYEELSRISRVMGYGSISKAVRDAVELFIAFNRWWTASGRVFGTIQVLLSPARRGAEEKVLAVEKRFENIVKAVLRTSTSGGYTLHILVVDGHGDTVKQLYKELVRVDGVLAVQTSLLPGHSGEGGAREAPSS